MKNEKIKEVLKSKKGKVILSSCVVTVLAAAIIAAVAININLKPQKEIIVKHGTLAGNVVTASDTAGESSSTTSDNTNTSASSTSSGTGVSSVSGESSSTTSDNTNTSASSTSSGTGVSSVSTVSSSAGGNTSTSANSTANVTAKTDKSADNKTKETTTTENKNSNKFAQKTNTESSSKSSTKDLSSSKKSSGESKSSNNNSGVTADKYVRHDAIRYYTDEITGIKQAVHFMYVEFANEVGGGYADINTTAEMGAAHHGDAVAKLIGSNGLKIIDTSVGVSRDGNCGSFTFANLTPGNYTVELIAKDGTVVAKYHFTVKDGGKV